MKKILLLLLLPVFSFSQIEIKVFNAEWNKSNDVTWVKKLDDVKVVNYVDISKNTKAQKKYKIAVVPTIIIFKDGEEVSRFQADLSFIMVATREEVQEEIDELLMEDF
tara:strand:- start:60 stop:383 length:324 start_codon:yes stop_codon:yes gene_type:complete